MADELGYQSQSSQLTLAEGIAEYFSAYRSELATRELSTEACEFFRCHDTLHVIWGCDLSLENEIVVKIASFFGTDGGRKVWRGYSLPDSKEIYEEISASEILKMTLKSLIIVPQTLWRCMRMSKRWSWDNFEEYQNMPLVTLREQFGIRVPKHQTLAKLRV